LTIHPDTSMPQNFTKEHELTLKDGTILRGVDYRSPASGKSERLKVGGEYRTFTPGQVVTAHMTRWVGTAAPESLKDFKGDYVDLMARYLLLHYNQAEIDATKPK